MPVKLHVYGNKQLDEPRPLYPNDIYEFIPMTGPIVESNTNKRDVLVWDTVNLFVTALSVILNPVPSVEFADNTEATN